MSIKKMIIKMTLVLIVIVNVLIATDLTDAADSDTKISETAYAATVEYGERYGISPELLQALIERESDGDPNVVYGGCMGLCQIYEKYHYDRMEKLGVQDPFDERENILVAADYLAELFQEYEDVSLVLDIYNGNSKAKHNFEYGIVSDYADHILKRSAELERLHGK